ncbi:hypothetical protein ANN_10416 [Periplaneta americana]|uniref:Uncharacterized protein n=1 Tax=Periplaneta americana TaxID=6978 RepID=A0ABQ8TRQ2_PERAM|nr:hypothetical protein ANN_10416 [Periplaneta americana]
MEVEGEEREVEREKREVEKEERDIEREKREVEKEERDIEREEREVEREVGYLSRSERPPNQRCFVPPLPESLPELRARIIIAIAAIDMDTLSRVWDELNYRLDVCKVYRAPVRASQSDRMFQLEGITDAVVDSLVINPTDDSSDDSDLFGSNWPYT